MSLVPVECSPQDARALTDRIKTAVGMTWELVKEAYETRAWSALGYGSWDDYCSAEFGAYRLRLPREERQEVVGSLREAGLSLRAIEAATGVSRKTVIDDIQVVESTPPARLGDPGVEFFCDCGEIFDIEVWHCPGCDHHWGTGTAECKNCTKVRGTDGKSYPRTNRPLPTVPTEHELAAQERQARYIALLRAADSIRTLPEPSQMVDEIDPVLGQRLLPNINHAAEWLTAFGDTWNSQH